MIYQNTTFENPENQFAKTFHGLHLGKLLRKTGIRKAQGASAYEVFQFLLLLVFQGILIMKIKIKASRTFLLMVHELKESSCVSQISCSVLFRTAKIRMIVVNNILVSNLID